MQAIRQAEHSLWVSRPRRILSRSLGAWVYLYLFCCCDQIPGKKREEGLILAHLRVQSILARRCGGKEAPCHDIWTQVHPTFQGARKQRKRKMVLSWIVPPSLYPGWDSSSGMLPSTLKTGTSHLNSLLWKRHTKLYAALMPWFFHIPIKPTIGIHHHKCWWMSELRVYLSNTWN